MKSGVFFCKSRSPEKRRERKTEFSDSDRDRGRHRRRPRRRPPPVSSSSSSSRSGSQHRPVARRGSLPVKGLDRRPEHLLQRLCRRRGLRVRGRELHGVPREDGRCRDDGRGRGGEVERGRRRRRSCCCFCCSLGEDRRGRRQQGGRSWCCCCCCCSRFAAAAAAVVVKGEQVRQRRLRLWLRRRGARGGSRGPRDVRRVRSSSSSRNSGGGGGGRPRLGRRRRRRQREHPRRRRQPREPARAPAPEPASAAAPAPLPHHPRHGARLLQSRRVAHQGGEPRRGGPDALADVAACLVVTLKRRREVVEKVGGREGDARGAWTAAGGEVLDHSERLGRAPPGRRRRREPAGQHARDVGGGGRSFAEKRDGAQLRESGAPGRGRARGGANDALGPGEGGELALGEDGGGVVVAAKLLF